MGPVWPECKRQMAPLIVVILETHRPDRIRRSRPFHRVPEDAVEQIFRTLVGLVERQVRPDLAVSIAYIGNHMVKGTSSTEGNPALFGPGATAALEATFTI